MKQINISSKKYPNTFALVDDEDFELLNQGKWSVSKMGNYLYASRWMMINGEYVNKSMHRFILDAQPGQEIDHADRNGLNNQKANLRFCTRAQNTQNSRKISGTSSRYKGVCWHKQTKKWRATININSKYIYLGGYENEVDAAKAYDEKIKVIYREFSLLNFTKDRR